MKKFEKYGVKVYHDELGISRVCIDVRGPENGHVDRIYVEHCEDENGRYFRVYSHNEYAGEIRYDIHREPEEY